MFILRPRGLKFLWLLLFASAMAWGQGLQAAPIPIAMVEGFSGPFANTGEAVHRNLLWAVWAVERVNQRGGVGMPAAMGGNRLLRLDRHDSKGQNEEALSALRSAVDHGARVVVQGRATASTRRCARATPGRPTTMSTCACN